jgi:hypothetical protein
VENGRTVLPQMYGDPKGYKHNGDPEFYHFTPNLFLDRLTEIYLWSMNRDDLARIPKDKGWIAYLEGADPEFPVRALQEDFEDVRHHVELMRNDPTSPDTRLADWLLGIVPPATDNLTQLTMGGYFSGGKLWALHSRLRYFDPVARRAGLPPDVGALVEKLTSDSVTVTLVNLSQVSPRELIVQAGGYREHSFTRAQLGEKSQDMNASTVTVRLEPGSGARLVLGMRRYANSPTLSHPWGTSSPSR